MKTSELLRKAADEIRRRGWTQRSYGSDEVNYKNCAVCALGAIHAVIGNGDPWYLGLEGDGARNELARVVGEKLPHRWNDAEGRTVEEVLDAFERAALKAEEDGD